MNDLQTPKILFAALLKGQLKLLENNNLNHSFYNYNIYKEAFLSTIASSEKTEPILRQILESFKSNVMQGDTKACYILAKVYEIGFYTQKEAYTANLLPLIGYK